MIMSNTPASAEARTEEVDGTRDALYQLGFAGELDAADVLNFMRALAIRRRRGLRLTTSPVILRCAPQVLISSTDWASCVSNAESVLNQLHVHLPGVRVANDADAVAGEVDRAWELRLRSSQRSLRTDNPEQISAALLAALGEQRSSENDHPAVDRRPWLPRPVVKPPSAKPPAKWSDYLLTDQQTARDSEAFRRSARSRPSRSFGVTGRIAVVADSTARQRQLLRRVLGALQLARQPGAGLVRRWFLPSVARHRTSRTTSRECRGRVC